MNRIARLILYCAASVALIASAAPAVAASLTTYTSETAFLSALGNPHTLETFDGYDSGTPINDQIPGTYFTGPGEGFTGIQTFASAGAVSPSNILTGGAPIEPAAGVAQDIHLYLSPSVSGAGFYLTGLNSLATAVTVRFDFYDESSQDVLVADSDENQNTAEFIGGISDTPITSVHIISGLFTDGNLYDEFGKDNLFLPGEQEVNDTTPPICSGTPSTIGGVRGIDGKGDDSGEGESGIDTVVLEAGAVNVSFSLDPEFTSGDGTAHFRVEPTNTSMNGHGTVLVTDLGGNTCTLPVTFSALPPGPTEALPICSSDGVLLSVSNPLVSPGGQAVCSAALPSFNDPVFPPGYEPSPETDPSPCTVMTILSPISGPTQMVYKKDGTFDPKLRLLFSRFNGSIFPPFSDITQSVEPIATITPDPTSVKGTGTWTQVKVTCATLSEVCNGLDDDGDGLIDEGLPVGGPPVDADGDGALLCAATPEAADCNDQIASIHPGAIETCNGMDDNCNGTIDEGHPTGGDDCGVAGLLGVCAAGKTSCADGPLVCKQVAQPTQEVCDGKDNNCDGAIDNGFVLSYRQPINADGSSIFKRGSTIPVKFALSNCSGAPINTAVAHIQLFLYQMGVVGSEVEDVTASGQANTDGLYRLSGDGQYIYNLSTRLLASKVSYVIRTTLDDGSHYDVVISLK